MFQDLNFSEVQSFGGAEAFFMLIVLAEAGFVDKYGELAFTRLASELAHKGLYDAGEFFSLGGLEQLHSAFDDEFKHIAVFALFRGWFRRGKRRRSGQ